MAMEYFDITLSQTFYFIMENSTFWQKVLMEHLGHLGYRKYHVSINIDYLIIIIEK